jgi:hypothetical protein
MSFAVMSFAVMSFAVLSFAVIAGRGAKQDQEPWGTSAQSSS